MQDNVFRIDYYGKEIILIATAHVSKESAALVQSVIDIEKPDSVCIELDEARYQTIQNSDSWERMDIINVIKSKKIIFLLANLALSSYQKRIAAKLDIMPGQEMLQGITSAKEIGANLVMADRSIQTTFMRIWRKLSLMEKGKLFFSFFMGSDMDTDITEVELQSMLKEDMLTSVIKDMHAQFPKIGDILLSERDQYLASKIKEAPGEKVVAILGAAHVPGVREEIFKTQDRSLLDEVPPANKMFKIIEWLIPAIVVALIIYGFMMSVQTGLAQLGAWVIWTGSLAAVFTAISFGHPLSIITSFVVAPISTLNPLLACGWFTGIVEAILRKPTVHDVHKIPEDISSVKGFFRNRFLRVLLIVVMANLGSSLGTFIAGMEIIKHLF
jgi:pheromone shutdown-related protein TraB